MAPVAIARADCVECEPCLPLTPGGGACSSFQGVSTCVGSSGTTDGLVLNSSSPPTERVTSLLKTFIQKASPYCAGAGRGAGTATTTTGAVGVVAGGARPQTGNGIAAGGLTGIRLPGFAGSSMSQRPVTMNDVDVFRMPCPRCSQPDVG